MDRVTSRLKRAAQRIRSWVARRPLSILALLAVGGIAAVSTGGYYAYQTWDYIEHDNDFCMSCHLMQDPFERFAESSHRDLSCKACHKPSLVSRSQMAMTQVVENPDSIGAHAEVGNDKCAACHVDGDPEQWNQIAATAGHRVHLESDDPALEGFMCVECHTASLHRFTATEETCSQSGCHTDVEVQLGAMADLTIHCAACHGFSRVVDDGADLATAVSSLAPDRDTCLSCHAMQVMVDMPADEPHGGVCSSCHNPHDQATPEAAVESCATAGCHDDPASLNPFHRGLAPGGLDDCSSCHTAHVFRLDGSDCASCHSEQDRARPSGVSVLHRTGDVRPLFDHGDHPGVACISCHETADAHGALSVSTVADCRGCHHVEPLASECATCHEGSELASASAVVAWSMSIGVPARAPMVREVAFAHADHSGVATCATCHAPGPDRLASAATCNGCHVEHHEAAQECLSCHVAAPAAAHPVEQVHLGCGGVGCHSDMPDPLQDRLRERATCLSCHQAQAVDHHDPAAECVTCHLLPPPARAPTP